MLELRFKPLSGRNPVAWFVIAATIVIVGAPPIITKFGIAKLLACPFRMLTGVPCPTCGYLRACDLVGQGQLFESIRFQPFIPAIITLCLAMSILALRSIRSGAAFNPSQRLVCLIVGLLAASWVWNITHHL